MSFLIPPPNPPSSVNIDDFVCFTESYESWEIATGLNVKTDNLRTATFLAICGQQIFGIYRALNLSAAESDKLVKIIEAIKKKIEPKRNLIYERYVFNSLVQSNEELMESFVMRLKKSVKNCKYNALEDELLRDRLVVGIRDDALRRSLLVKDELNVNTAISMCLVQEATDVQLREISNKKVEDVLHIRSTSSGAYRSRGQQRNSDDAKSCENCGYRHFPKNCLAFGKQCYKCNKPNHFASMCRNRYRSPRRVQTLEEVDENFDEMPIAAFETISSISERHTNSKVLTTMLMVSPDHDREGRAMRQKMFQMDTGASCNVMSLDHYAAVTNLSHEQLGKSTVMLRAFGNNLIKPLGTGILRCHTPNRKYRLLFQIIDFEILPILSFNTCHKLNLISINPINSLTSIDEYKVAAKQIMDKWSDVFDGQGKLDGVVHLELKPNAVPSSEAPRRVPEALRESLRQELSRMESEDIIEKIDYHTDYISNLVLVKKTDNKLRICLDPFKLNKDLHRCDYQIPKLEEILPKLTNARVFTKLDAKNGYWQLELSTESKKLTAFWTPFGRYVFKRLAFGLKPASEIYQQRQHEIVDGLDGVQVIHDDIIVYGRGESDENAWQDHNLNLDRVLARLSESKLKLNRNKTIVGEAEIPFFGHVLSKSGLKIDNEKTRAVREMPTPNDAKAVQRFVGVVNYLSKFLPRLSTEIEPIRKLIHATSFIWTNEHDQIFNNLKKLVSSAPVLSYFDLQKHTVIQCDSSSTGLGSVLLQEGKPVYYASRALTNTEIKYAQIEKECLAILFSCKKFDQYVCGNSRVTIETDHKPLIAVFNREICKAPRRLQRMMLELQRYTFKLEYKKGTEIVLADTLSRAYINDSDDNNDLEAVYMFEDRSESIFQQIENINMLDDTEIDDIVQIREATAVNPEMCKIMEAISVGWKLNKSDEDELIRKHWTYRDQLTIQDGLVFKGEKLMIPKEMIAATIERLHYGHTGRESCIKKARDTLFWSGMSDDIKRAIDNCAVCIQNGPANRKLPMQIHNVPVYPFQRVGIDLCEVTQANGEKINMLVTEDYYSDFFEVDFLKSTTANLVIECCKRNFSRHGVPAVVISDNGPQFISEEFRDFAQLYRFKHSTCSPYHHLGNGKAESAVKIAENLYIKAKASKREFWLALLEFRNTPNSIGSSPAQRLMSRRTRSLVPMTPNNLQPRVEENVRDKILERKKQIKQQYDKGSRELPQLEIGQSVFVQRRPDRADIGWEPGVVRNKLSSRSYNVEVNGKIYRRNRQHLKKNPNPFSQNVPRSKSVKSNNNSIRKRVRFSEEIAGEFVQMPKTNTNSFYLNIEQTLTQPQTLEQQQIPAQLQIPAESISAAEQQVPIPEQRSSIADQQLRAIESNQLQQNDDLIHENLVGTHQNHEQAGRPVRNKKVPNYLKDFTLNID